MPGPTWPPAGPHPESCCAGPHAAHGTGIIPQSIVATGGGAGDGDGEWCAGIFDNDEDGRIDLLGCNVAEGEQGKAFVGAIEQEYSCNFAASDGESLPAATSAWTAARTVPMSSFFLSSAFSFVSFAFSVFSFFTIFASRISCIIEYIDRFSAGILYFVAWNSLYRHSLSSSVWSCQFGSFASTLRMRLTKSSLMSVSPVFALNTPANR